MLEPLERRALLAANLGLIAGTAFVDKAGDGLTADDVRLPNVTVTLTGTTGQGSAVTKTTTTDAAGRYFFDNLADGAYFVQQTTVVAGLRPSATQPVPVSPPPTP